MYREGENVIVARGVETVEAETNARLSRQIKRSDAFRPQPGWVIGRWIR